MYPENNFNEQEEKKVSGNAPENAAPETVGNTSQTENEKANELPNTYAQNPNLRWQNQAPNANADNPNLRWQNQGVDGQNPNLNGNPNFVGNPNFNGQNPNFNGNYNFNAQQPYDQPFYGQPPVEKPGKGLGIAGFVLSICSFVCCCVHPFISFVFIVVGMILSIVGRVQSKKAGFKNGLATAGMIITIVHAVIWVLLIAFVLIMPLIFGEEIFDEILREYSEYSVNM